jgi:ribonuclease P protein component
MIARGNRFHGYGSLRYVYQHGKTVRGPLTALKYVANPKRSDYRLAVVVSKKVHKSAVVRNRIRRRLYEAARRQQIQQGYDLVLTVFQEGVGDMPAEELERLVKAQLRQAGVPTNASAEKTHTNQ